MTGETLVSQAIIDPSWKGFPPELAGLSVMDAVASSKSLLKGDFLMPVAILRGSALERNLLSMKAFCEATGVALCPHGKTTMSPELFRMQLDAGAWGITAATAHHVRLYRRWGVQRIFLANQLIAPADIALIVDELKEADFEFFCLVDSQEGVLLLAQAARDKGLLYPINVLVEMGSKAGRTGVRSIDNGLDLGRAIAKESDVLALRGVEIFEGIHSFDGDGPGAADAMLDDLIALARILLNDDLFADGEIILTGGGSAMFDLCASRLVDVHLEGRARTVLRSGCYIAHDHGTYAAAIAALRRRQPEQFAFHLDPEAALEIWGVVQSIPEPGSAVVSIGKRDVGFDADLPKAIWHYRNDMTEPVAPSDELQITKLYDQHACLAGADELAVGDLVGFGISHPCTTFDRWRAIPIVDGEYRMTNLVTTAF